MVQSLVVARVFMQIHFSITLQGFPTMCSQYNESRTKSGELVLDDLIRLHLLRELTDDTSGETDVALDNVNTSEADHLLDDRQQGVGGKVGSLIGLSVHNGRLRGQSPGSVDAGRHGGASGETNSLGSSKHNSM